MSANNNEAQTDNSSHSNSNADRHQIRFISFNIARIAIILQTEHQDDHDHCESPKHWNHRLHHQENFFVFIKIQFFN